MNRAAVTLIRFIGVPTTREMTMRLTPPDLIELGRDLSHLPAETLQLLQRALAAPKDDMERSAIEAAIPVALFFASGSTRKARETRGRPMELSPVKVQMAKVIVRRSGRPKKTGPSKD